MYTVEHEDLDVHVNEPVRLRFPVTDRDGNEVSLDGVGVEAEYTIAKEYGDTAIVRKIQGSGITLSGNVATVNFNTNEVKQGTTQMSGFFVGQLRITIDGDDLVVAKGKLKINKVIL